MGAPVGIFDTVRRAFGVTNRNLPAILVQIIYIIALFAVLAVMALVLFAMFAGSLAGLREAALNPENLGNLLKSSVGLIFMAVVFLFVFIVIAALLNAVAQAGTIGCLAKTASGEAEGFTMSVFFSSVGSSSMSLFWLQILVSLIGLGVMAGLALVGIICFGLVLIPLKDAGNMVAAFAIGVPLIVLLILAVLVFLFVFYSGSMLAQVSLVAGVRKAVESLGDTYRFIKERFWEAMLFTLLVLFLVVSASMLIELITLPFRFLGGDNGAALVLLIPLTLVSYVLRLYVGVFAVACFVVYYVSATMPPGETPEAAYEPGTGEFIPYAEVLEPDEPEPDTEDRGFIDFDTDFPGPGDDRQDEDAPDEDRPKPPDRQG